jgi:hypothetical protein
MRRALEVIALLATTLALFATSAERVPCATETTTLHAQTTCGAAGDVVLTSDVRCNVTLSSSVATGLPRSGSVDARERDAGVMVGFQLMGLSPDGGNTVSCFADPADGGLAVTCTPSCGFDAGPCEEPCSGTLTVP